MGLLCSKRRGGRSFLSRQMATAMEFVEVEESIQERMTRLEERLASFVNWPERDVSPDDLAYAGFYYVGADSITICPFCDMIKNDWASNDEGMLTHYAESPMCPFVRDPPDYVWRNMQEPRTSTPPPSDPRGVDETGLYITSQTLRSVNLSHGRMLPSPPESRLTSLQWTRRMSSH